MDAKVFLGRIESAMSDPVRLLASLAGVLCIPPTGNPGC